MKISKISLFAAAVLVSGAYAADDIVSALKEGKMDGRLRVHYFYTNWDKNGKDGQGLEDSKGLAVGGSAIFKTAPVNGFSAGFGAYTTQNPGGLTDNQSTATGAATSKITTAADLFLNNKYSTGYSVVAQAYAQYDVRKTTVKAGRMLLSNPFVSPNDTKMIPEAFEAYTVESKDAPDTMMTALLVTKVKERRRDTFSTMLDTADTPDALKAYYGSGGTFGNRKIVGGHTAPNLAIAGVKNTSVKNLELQGWLMTLPDVVSQYVLEANYKMPVSSGAISAGARVFEQRDDGAGDIIKPSQGDSTSKAAVAQRPKGNSRDSINTHLYAFRVIGDYAGAKLLLSYAITSKDGDILAPWRAFPTDGYTRSMTQTDWMGNTKSYKMQLDYDFSRVGINGLSALASYAFYDRDPNRIPYQSMTDRGYGNGDTRQINVDAIYKFSGSMKGLESKVRLMSQKNDITAFVPGDSSNKEMRVEFNYLF